MDSNRGGAVAYAAKPGFHPSDGPSGRITQNEEAIYSVVVFYKGIPQTETSPSTAQRAPAYIHGMGYPRQQGLLRYVLLLFLLFGGESEPRLPCSLWNLTRLASMGWVIRGNHLTR